MRYNPICASTDLPCNGEPSDDYNNTGGWELVLDTVVQLERVELFVRSKKENTVCVGLACREYLEDLKTIYENSSGPVKAALWDLLRSPKLLQKCVPYSHVLPPDSLGKATEVMKTAPAVFRANEMRVVAGDTFDVQQIDGKVFRFAVSLVEPDGAIRDVAYVGPVNVGTASSCR